ncbi:hypothetical protein [Leptolyngbya sp. NIES-2104]|uniref:hypothetical protein n=1 Tax=Leptolyngbya sp. NIES-2104 TaxID=1552121 RepID=UPI0006EC61ED|nr:hypothetical protein [Leptolyngbya sp. NIES-2104]GAP94401.1 hypothetical protein NIES2104_09120 [Leptolyngbya sp. NIES-2104]
MTELDFVLLTVYFLCVTYVLYQMVTSFNDEFTIWLDQDYLNEQLETLNLREAVGISFKFENRYEFDKLKKLQIRINNKLQDQAIYVDWDYCAMTDQYEPPRSRRITRGVAGNPTDVFPRQAFSAIAPGKTLTEDLFAEDMLSRKDGSSALQGDETVLSFKKPAKTASAAKKRLYQDFMNGEALFKFELYLVLRFMGFGASAGGDRVSIVCRLNVRKLDWTAGLPWNPKFP